MRLLDLKQILNVTTSLAVRPQSQDQNSANQMYRSEYICEHCELKQQVPLRVHSSHGGTQGTSFLRQQWQGC